MSSHCTLLLIVNLYTIYIIRILINNQIKNESKKRHFTTLLHIYISKMFRKWRSFNILRILFAIIKLMKYYKITVRFSKYK